ncbi:hypothetical protein ACQUWL_20265 [Serratia marcescens]|uniref:hypothetical protein n=1 Tax=Serratia marcescens TaxID=615 RepID=UPI003D172A0B
MDVYHQALIQNFKGFTDGELCAIAGESECAHRALMKGMRSIGDLMVSATPELNEDEIKSHFVAIGDLLTHLPRYAEALFENAGNADYEIKRREKIKSDAGKAKLREIVVMLDSLGK